jgi:hypothetical protein
VVGGVQSGLGEFEQSPIMKDMQGFVQRAKKEDGLVGGLAAAVFCLPVVLLGATVFGGVHAVKGAVEGAATASKELWGGTSGKGG